MRLAIRRFQLLQALPFSEDAPHRSRQAARSCLRSRGSLVPRRERFAQMRRAPIPPKSFSSGFLCGRHHPLHIHNQKNPRPRSDEPIDPNANGAAPSKSRWRSNALPCKPFQILTLAVASLFLFGGTERWLPSRRLLARRRGNCLDLLFFGLLGLSIALLLAFGHADLPGVDDDTVIECRI